MEGQPVPPLRSSQPPLSRKLMPRARSRAACQGCRLRDQFGLGLRNDQHACELFTFGLRVCFGLPCPWRGPGAGPWGSLRNAATLLGSPTSFARGGLVRTCPGRAARWARREHGVGEDGGRLGCDLE